MKLLIALLMLPLSVSALDLELGCGQTLYEKPGNGEWFQKEFEHSMDMRATSCHAAVVYAYSDTIDLRLGYVDLGKISTSALASASDELYADFQRGAEDIGELSNWFGEGRSRGVVGTIDYRFKWVTVRAGVWYHKSAWKMHVPDWRVIRKSSKGYSFGGAQSITVHAEEEHTLGGVLGVVKEIRGVVVAAELYEVKGGGAYFPAQRGTALNVNISYRF
jgi:hypothetical protein